MGLEQGWCWWELGTAGGVGQVGGTGACWWEQGQGNSLWEQGLELGLVAQLNRWGWVGLGAGARAGCGLLGAGVAGQEQGGAGGELGSGELELGSWNRAGGTVGSWN
ncbi:heterogeneous nuclear ribonucleoprotein 87F-like, partial [Armigeres subalbatus]|uniref:heterogeneous nuclear ribonucleoprotein 87F-like n=1 Tax=Armigeres subalbatus TaxID=124917 RepID=UPI002ED33049